VAKIILVENERRAVARAMSPVSAEIRRVHARIGGCIVTDLGEFDLMSTLYPKK
jgi:hypothetical protein